MSHGKIIWVTNQTGEHTVNACMQYKCNRHGQLRLKSGCVSSVTRKLMSQFVLANFFQKRCQHVLALLSVMTRNKEMK